jgi:hypothetical protein
MSTELHEITWTVRHKHVMRLTQDDIDGLAASLHLAEGCTNDDVIQALYEDRAAEEVLAEFASDRTWLSDGDAQMSFDNPIREAKS